MPAIELPPLTEAHREAIRNCRFYTPNMDHTHAWAWTDDVDVLRVLVPGAGMNAAERQAAGADEHPRVGAATLYRRSSEPLKHEWEIAFTHPDAVAFICDLCAVRRG